MKTQKAWNTDFGLYPWPPELDRLWKAAPKRTLVLTHPETDEPYEVTVADNRTAKGRAFNTYEHKLYKAIETLYCAGFYIELTLPESEGRK